MSEEQLKAVEAEATVEQEEGSGEEISEDDLEGVAGGCIWIGTTPNDEVNKIPMH